MKLKITKDANGVYTLWKVQVSGLFPFRMEDKSYLKSSKNAAVVLDEMRSLLGNRIETGLLDVECVEEEA